LLCCAAQLQFVYEELAIAAYLISLFETEREDSDVKQSFVDLGCGNGFLTYLLREEGYPGKGIDINRRGIWNMYPDHVSQCLLQETIEPESYSCPEVDWIIGNHSDELTPWIPAIAARSQRQKHTSTSTVAGPKFFVLPCCFYDFDKKKFAFSSMRRSLAVPDTGDGKYAQYLNYIERVCVAFGFGVDGAIERENMRIPSTKYVALLGRRIQDRARTRPETVREIVNIATWDAEMSHT
jgi:tRNASer (uridine44-2'-O)-methyltransferase